MVPDYILFNMDRREVMGMQVEMSYRAYVAIKLEMLQEQYSVYVDKYWSKRTNEHVNMMKAYTKAIDTTEKLYKSIKESSDEFRE